MKIISMTVTKPFRYLWLKTVKDVNLSEHCAKSLIGKYDSRINNTISQYDDIELEDSIYYLCGVSIPFVWENNFHLAFMPEKDSVIYYESNGITVRIDGAKKLPISDEYLDKNHPKIKYKSYATCRNWQFAHFLKNSGLL